MATPRNSSYSGASGETLRGGRASAALPAYLSGLAVGGIVNLPLAVPVGGLNGFCGWAYDPATNRVLYGAAGGHDFDGSDNCVQALDLLQDNPAWLTLKAGTPFGQVNIAQAYNLDNTPNARHTYHYTHWAPTQGRIMLLGNYAPYGGVNTFNTCDGYSVTGGAWNAPNTLDPCVGGRYGNARMGNGDVWALWGTGGSRLWSEATMTWSNPTLTGPTSTFIRFPWAWDSLRGQLFGCAFGDSQGSGTDLRALTLNGTTLAAITLNGSGLAQFQADANATGVQGQYAGMTYDAANDRFLWYSGKDASQGRIYAIAPNGGTTWTVTQLTTTGAALPATVAGGINSKFTYVDLGAVKGVVLMASMASGCYFLRTA